MNGLVINLKFKTLSEHEHTINTYTHWPTLLCDATLNMVMPQYVVCSSSVFYPFITSGHSRAFPVAAPRIWNSLPEHVVMAATLQSFKKHLKTFMMQQSYSLALVVLVVTSVT